MSNIITNTVRTAQTAYDSLLCRVAVLGLILGTVPSYMLSMLAVSV